MTVGERIKNRRKQLGLSVEQLSELLGKDRATIYRYENSSIEKLPITVLEPLAQALRTSPAYLMGWTESHQTAEKCVTQHPYPFVLPENLQGVGFAFDGGFDGLTQSDIDTLSMLVESMKKKNKKDESE